MMLIGVITVKIQEDGRGKKWNLEKAVMKGV